MTCDMAVKSVVTWDLASPFLNATSDIGENKGQRLGVADIVKGRHQNSPLKAAEGP